MKLTIRPLQQGKGVFVVEVEPSQTIHDLKLRISEHGIPIEAQKLLKTGNALIDDRTIDSYGIKDASTLVLMIKASSAAVTPTPSKSNSPGTAQLNLPSPLPTPVPTASSNNLTVPSPAYATQTSASRGAAASSIAISEPGSGFGLNGTGISSNAAPSQSNINQIVSMGFTQAQAERTLRVTSNNLDQALDLLLGDPDNQGPTGSVQAPISMANGLGPPSGLGGGGFGLANGAGPLSSSGLPQSLIPPNLMKMVAQQQQQQELPDMSSMSLGALGGLGGALGGGLGGGDGAGPSSGGATAEVTAEQIEEIRRMVAFNPTLIKPFLEHLKEDDFELWKHIDGDPEKLLTAFSRGAEESGGPSASTPPAFMPPPSLPPAVRTPDYGPPAPAAPPVARRAPEPAPGAQSTTISVTQEEHDQIEGIVGMGFDRNTVLQAYVACERDADRAIEFLLAGAFE